MDRNVELFIGIHKNLIASKCIIEPSIYIRPEVDKNLTLKLREIIKRHQAKCVESEHEATHVVHPPTTDLAAEETSKDNEQQQFVRIIAKREKEVLIHWVRSPDSHDSWQSIDTDFEPEEARDNNPSTAFQVEATWLLDLEKFNEWMNEGDYACPAESDKQNSSNNNIKTKTKYTMEELLADERQKSEKKKESGGAANNNSGSVNSNSNSKTKRRRSPSPQTDKKRKGKNTEKSVRSPAAANAAGSGEKSSHKKKLFKNEDDENDLSKDMDDASPEPNIQEVNLAATRASMAATRNSTGAAGKAGGLSAINDETVPIKGGTLMDLDGDYDDKQDGGSKSRSDSPTALANGNGTAAGVSHGYEKGDDQGGDDNVTEQANHIIVPSYASWFDYNCIHAVERRGLPEFFNGRNKSKTPEVYLACRNFMIDTYRLNPTEYLTITAVRRNIAGDVCAIMRVHAFLEQWGLINYQVDADSRPTPMGPPSTSHFHVFVDTPNGLQTLHQPPRAVLSASQQMVNLPKENGVAVKEEKNGVLDPSNLSADNFGLKVDQYGKKGGALKGNKAGAQSREWTEQETLLLLEGLEMYKDDWNKVCEHVGSRTQDECILYFLRLPIEDPYLDDKNSSLGPLAYNPVPFSKAGNPIMSTVAFLASVVDPRIAASAAEAAMKEFAKIKEEIPPSVIDAHSKNVDAIGDTDDGAEKAGEDKDKEDKENKKDEAGTKTNGEEAEVKKEGEDSNDKDESMEVDGGEVGSKKPDGESKDKSGPSVNVAELSDKERNLIKESQISVAAAAALGSAAVKAKHLAAVEEKKIKSLVALLVETQMKKLEIKLRHFEELEAIMDREKETVSANLYLQEHLLIVVFCIISAGTTTSNTGARATGIPLGADEDDRESCSPACTILCATRTFDWSARPRPDDNQSSWRWQCCLGATTTTTAPQPCSAGDGGIATTTTTTAADTTDSAGAGATTSTTTTTDCWTTASTTAATTAGGPSCCAGFIGGTTTEYSTTGQCRSVATTM